MRSLLFVLFVLAGLRATSQEMPIPPTYGQSIGTGASGNYNLSKPGNAYYIGIGVLFNLELPLKTLGLNSNISTGFTNFFENRVTKNLFLNPKGSSYTNYNYVNIDLGAKYYINLPFYVATSLGAIYGFQASSKTALSCSSGIGLALPFRNNAIDLSIHYIITVGGYSEPLSNTGQIVSARLTYKFGLDN